MGASIWPFLASRVIAILGVGPLMNLPALSGEPLSLALPAMRGSIPTAGRLGM